jgi:hypothetical protein
MTTTTRSLGAGNASVDISPSHEEYSFTLQWNANPIPLTTSTKDASNSNQFINESDTNDVVSNDAESHDVESNQFPLQMQTSEDAVNGNDDYDDASTVVISNHNHPSSLFHNIFHSHGKAATINSKKDSISSNMNPKSSIPPVETVVTRSRNNLVTPIPIKTKTSTAKSTNPAVV